MARIPVRVIGIWLLGAGLMIGLLDLLSPARSSWSVFGLALVVAGAAMLIAGRSDTGAKG
jgi:hypothetical protein